MLASGSAADGVIGGVHTPKNKALTVVADLTRHVNRTAPDIEGAGGAMSVAVSNQDTMGPLGPVQSQPASVDMAGEVGDDGQRLVFRGVDHAADRRRRQLILDASMRTEDRARR